MSASFTPHQSSTSQYASLTKESVAQGYVDEDSDVMTKISAFFGGGKKKKADADPKPVADAKQAVRQATKTAKGPTSSGKPITKKGPAKAETRQQTKRSGGGWW